MQTPKIIKEKGGYYSVYIIAKVIHIRMKEKFSEFKKIDAHSHIGQFGSPFNIDFDVNRLIKQMEEFHIEKTILCPAGCH